MRFLLLWLALPWLVLPWLVLLPAKTFFAAWLVEPGKVDDGADFTLTGAIATVALVAFIRSRI